MPLLLQVLGDARQHHALGVVLGDEFVAAAMDKLKRISARQPLRSGDQPTVGQQMRDDAGIHGAVAKSAYPT